MKRFSILVLGAVALLGNACEKHDPAKLPPPHSTQFGDHAWSPKGGNKHHGETHAAEHKAPEAAPGATPAAAPEGEGAKTLNFLPKDK